MARGPDKQFDPEIALDKAMQLFWAKGYSATGLTELLETMEIGRKSLYDTFGNKRALYIKALDRYSQTTVGKLYRGAQRPRPTRIEERSGRDARLRRRACRADEPRLLAWRQLGSVPRG